MARNHPYYGEITQSEMRALLDDVPKVGFEQAVRNRIKDPFVLTYILDEMRAKWIEVLPITKESIVLDVGCGWGTNALPLARKCRSVIALDATRERIEAVSLRAKEQGIENIHVRHGSAMELPLPSASCDIVIFNGVIEWLGTADPARSPSELQNRALRQAYRVLRPGGTVYIGIENRISLRYFMGAADDHSFIRFTSLMPRAVANWYCKVRKGEPYSTYTYSLDRYHRMLVDNGFTAISDYYPIPNYRNPVAIVPLKRAALREYFAAELMVRPRSWRRRLYTRVLSVLTRLEGRGRFVHSFLFTAVRPF